MKPRSYKLFACNVFKLIAISTIASMGIVNCLLQKNNSLSAAEQSTTIAQVNSQSWESKNKDLVTGWNVHTLDIVIKWNALTLNIVRTEQASPQMAARSLAMVHSAIYEAVNAISKTHKVYRVKVQAAKGASDEAAAIAAAHQVLVNLYPKQAATLDTAKAGFLLEIAEGKSKTDGVKLGQSVADKILAWRQNDGADAKVAYTPINKPGYWQPVPPDFSPASMPHWKDVKPFAMTKGSQFRIKNYPSLTSPKYVVEFNQIKQIGALNSTTRTTGQTVIAKFWLDGAGTITPPGHWNQIAADVAIRRGNTLQQNARLFALLNIALADASIVDSDEKYTFNRWRPITGIRQADKDDNPQTSADPNWTPLLTTPSSPAYVSGHSTFGGAADAILTAFFGKNVSFTTPADPALNFAPRSFSSFTQAAEEAGISRIYGGVHWSSDNRDGLIAGRNLGRYVVQNFLLPE